MVVSPTNSFFYVVETGSVSVEREGERLGLPQLLAGLPAHADHGRGGPRPAMCRISAIELQLLTMFSQSEAIAARACGELWRVSDCPWKSKALEPSLLLRDQSGRCLSRSWLPVTTSIAVVILIIVIALLCSCS